VITMVVVVVEEEGGEVEIVSVSLLLKSGH
jgi:hypothetical protein